MNQKTKFTLVLSVLVLIIALPVVYFAIKGIYASSSKSDGKGCVDSHDSKLSLSKTSAIADGKDTIKMTINVYAYRCTGEPTSNYPENYMTIYKSICLNYYDPPTYQTIACPSEAVFRVTVSGSGNILSQTSNFSVLGSRSVTLKSTGAGTKTINLYNNGCSANKLVATRTVNFSRLPSSGDDKTDNDNISLDRGSSGQTTANIDAGETVFAVATINGQELDENKILSQEIKQGEPIVFAGTGEPESKIKFYIHSETIEKEVGVDKEGSWELNLVDTTKLAIGQHAVEVAIIGKDGKESERELVAKFNLIESDDTPTPLPATSGVDYLGYVILGIVIVLIIVIVVLYIKKRKTTQNPSNIKPNIQ